MFVVMCNNVPMAASTDVKKAYEEAARLLECEYDDTLLIELQRVYELDSADFGAGDVRVVQVSNLDVW